MTLNSTLSVILLSDLKKKIINEIVVLLNEFFVITKILITIKSKSDHFAYTKWLNYNFIYKYWISFIKF